METSLPKLLASIEAKSSKPTVWDGDSLAGGLGKSPHPPEGSKPTVWDGDPSGFFGDLAAQHCSKPTVWDGDEDVLALVVFWQKPVLSSPCGMETTLQLEHSQAYYLF